MNAPAKTHENPLGLDGFEFVEFTGPDPEALAGLFVAMGFTHMGNHRSKNVRHYAQGDINFILNMDQKGQVAGFRDAHGPSANAMAFRVKDAKKALALAVERGATPVECPRGPGELDIPAIEGIGGSYLYLVDRYGAEQIYARVIPSKGRRATQQPAAPLATHPHVKSRPD